MVEQRSTSGASRFFVWCGLALYALAWFIPASRILPPCPSLPRTYGGPDWLPGWVALRFAWDGLVSNPEVLSEVESKVLGATCLTNVVMILCIAVVMAG